MVKYSHDPEIHCSHLIYQSEKTLQKARFSSLPTPQQGCVPPPPPPPSLTANGICVSPEVAEFTVTNNGGDKTAPFTFTITDQSGTVIQSGKIRLKAGGSVTLQVNGPYQVLILNLTDPAGTTVRAAMADCVKPISSVGPAEPGICIQCLVFHTFRDDNLEVYRLDGIEGQADFKLYNLSKEAVDSRPSRAPNDSWVVFQSNRDGNVELYYTDLLGSGEAIRLTETQSNNTNPMYAPDAQTIVFQSDRNGRFDLFTIDQQTGEEVQITSNPADDVNAFYSPEIETLVFQSNRNGRMRRARGGGDPRPQRGAPWQGRGRNADRRRPVRWARSNFGEALLRRKLLRKLQTATPPMLGSGGRAARI